MNLYEFLHTFYADIDNFQIEIYEINAEHDFPLFVGSLEIAQSDEAYDQYHDFHDYDYLSSRTSHEDNKTIMVIKCKRNENAINIRHDSIYIEKQK